MTRPRPVPGGATAGRTGALSRRRFLTVVAGALALPVAAAAAVPLRQWRGVAMGADASITLAHPDAATILDRALAEISRLERVFSLYRPDSALSRLNAEGELPLPPFDLLECLALCRRVHAATGGLFDPTVQPLWALHAERAAQGAVPEDAEIAAVLPRVGFDAVEATSQRVRYLRPGMAMTLNGVAQGHVADRVAGFLAGLGLSDILVETGEFRALGGHPDGGGWQVGIAAEGAEAPIRMVALRDRALATSAPMGTVLDAAGQVGHILHPATGRPAPARWRLVSVTAPRAGMADALSTAMCLMDRDGMAAVLSEFPEAELAALL